MRKKWSIITTESGLGPGVSIFIPDVLMGSTWKLHSHGILTEVWNMRVICLCPLPAQFSDRGPHTHSCPQPFGVDGWYIHNCHTASSAGRRSATYPPFPGHILGMVRISLPSRRRALARLQMGVLYMCVYSVAKLPREQHILAALISCPVCPWCLCWGKNSHLALWTL